MTPYDDVDDDDGDNDGGDGDDDDDYDEKEFTEEKIYFVGVAVVGPVIHISP